MKKLSIFLIIFSLISSFVTAQEQYGFIRGLVFNSAGEPLEDVLITLEGPYAPISNKTTNRGQFRFVNVLRGTYTAKFEASGYKTYLQKNIIIEIGTNIDLLIEMTLGSENETIVSEIIPTLDLKKTSTGANIPQESLEEIPSARDPWVLMQQQSSTMSTSENVGGSGSGQQSGWKARGAVGGSTIYNMDGNVITDGGGGSPAYYDYDALAEVQVTTAGNEASVQTGGTSINFVTKRGTNKFNINARTFYTSRHLQSDNRTEELKDLRLRGDKIWMIADYGFQMGGPIVKDKFWFWGGGSVQNINKRTIDGYKNDTTLNFANAKLNIQLGPRHRAEVGWIMDEKIVDGRAAASTRPPETTLLQKGPARIFKGEYEAKFSDAFLLSVKGCAFPSWWGMEPKGGMNVQAGYDQVTGMWSNSYSRSWNGVSSYGARTDSNLFLSEIIGGSHELKFGIEWRYLPRRYESGWPADAVQYYRNGISHSVKVYREREGKYYNSRYSAYLQDTYVKGRLTLNLGIRYDREANWIGESNIHASRFAPELLPAITWDGVDPDLIWNTFSPRFGLTYDLFGDRKTILNIVLARYGLTMNHGLVNHISIVQQTFVEYYWNDLNGDYQAQLDELAGYPDGFIDSTTGFDPNNPTTLTSFNKIDPDLSSPLTDEFSIGIQREVFTDFSLSAMFFARRNFNMLYPSNERPYIGVNQENFGEPIQKTLVYDGETYEYEYWTLDQQRPPGTLLANREDYHENFLAIEIGANKRLSNRWMANASFTYQNLTQHYGEKAYQDPTNIEFLDGAPLEDIQWMAKLSFMYQLPWGINVSSFANARQGRIFDRVLNVRTPERAAVGLGPSMNIRIEEYGTARYETFFNADLRVGKDFKLGKVGNVSFSVDLFNMFNFNWELNRYNIINSERYNMIQEILQPRVIRFSVRYRY